MNHISIRQFQFLVLAVFCFVLTTAACSQAVFESDKGRPGNAPPLTIKYIPGFLSVDYHQKEQLDIIEQIFPNSEVKRHSWNKANMSFEKAVQNADTVEPMKLLKEIEKMSPAERERLILIGHSLGGRIVIRTLHQLSQKKLQIRQGIILGAALDNDDEQVKTAILASKESIDSVINPTDDKLKEYHHNFFVGKKTALGTGYIGVLDHYCEIQTETSTNHDAVFYLAQYKMKRTMGQNCIIVPQVDYNVPEWMNEDDINKYKIIEKKNDWLLLEKNGWLSKSCLIVDDLSFVRAKGGSLKDIQQSFNKVKKQLEAGQSDCEIISNDINIGIPINQFNEIKQKKGSSKELGWKTIDAVQQGWRLQRFENSDKYRILDPACNVRSFIEKSKQGEMKNEFNKIKEFFIDLPSEPVDNSLVPAPVINAPVSAAP